jgi:N-acetylglucosaminyldiphosphoundecaprenol N-acetyl-beta-D-mannosaminyltransferase
MLAFLAAFPRARHAFVGSTQKTLAQLDEAVRERFGALNVHFYAPPMRDVTPQGVIEDLDFVAPGTDVIWVGLGTPKQQQWAEIARLHRPAALIVNVGAAFDFVAGTKRVAPRWMARLGLEWLYRLGSEPSRLWRRYIVGNPRFVAGVIRQTVGSKLAA